MPPYFSGRHIFDAEKNVPATWRDPTAAKSSKIAGTRRTFKEEKDTYESDKTENGTAGQSPGD